MKKTFYNPHTVITDITNLDKKWLEKQIKDKPYDQHYHYLEALRLIGTGDKRKFVDKVGDLLFNTSNSLRVSSLIDRAEPSTKENSNSISTIEIKSKKSEDMVMQSPLLSGIIPFVLVLDSIESESDSGPVTDVSDTQSESSMILDVIDISELDEEVAIIENGVITETNQETSQANPILLDEEEDEEEEEYVSNTVQLHEEPQIKIPQKEKVSIEEVKVEKIEVEAPHQSVAEEENQPSASESVQIQHSQFTSWLRGLPRLNEMNQLPETETKAQIISEPYAKILIDQGHKTDAIEMYEQLMLKYPEKSSFFADQIKKLK